MNSSKLIKRYKSTLAVLRLDELLSGAKFKAYDEVKSGNKNQSKLVKVILMSYSFEDIGLVKLTVGVRRRSGDKVQYGISAMEPGQTIQPIVRGNGKKKASHRK